MPAAVHLPDNEKTLEELVRQLTMAEEALQASAAGEVDAVVLGDGHPYLLHRARKASSETQALQARLVAIVESSEDAIFSKTLGGVVDSWNAGAEAIFGYTASEVIGTSGDMLSPPDLLQEEHALLEAIRNGERIVDFETSRLRKDGKRISVSISISPLKDREGKVVGFSKIARDITERKVAAEAAHANAKLLNLASQMGKLGAWAVDLLGFRITWSEEVCRIHEVDIDYVPQLESALNFYPLPERTKLEEALKTGEPYDLELKLITAKGNHRWVRSASSGEIEDGVSKRFVGMLQDITERKHAEEELRSTVKRAELAAKAGKVGIWELDIVDETFLWDDQMHALYGVSRGTLSGDYESWGRRLHPDDAARVLAAIAEASQPDGKPFDTAFRIILPQDGSTRHIRAQATVLRDTSGQPVRMIGTNWDVTQERMRERELADALEQQKDLVRAAQAGEKAKSQFLAVMSHEIRTPMNGILGFAELLANSPTLTRENRDLSQTIVASGEALLRILNDILDLSRIDAGGMTIEKMTFSPRELVRQIEFFVKGSIREKNLAFAAVVDGEVPENVEGDQGRIRQILLNLINNARKFTDEGSIALGLHVHRRETGECQLEYSVKDTGPGIPPEKIHAIFEPFTQSDSTISRRHGGTGLGLTISRRLAELMRGTIEVKSRLGEGSTFFLFLPLEAANFSASSSDVVPAGPLLDPNFAGRYPLSFLVVDDDKVNLKLMVSIARKLSYEPLTACNGLEAVGVYEKELPGCIFMDLQMPEMDGIEAVKQIRGMESASSISPAYIVALTANILPEEKERCMAAGMNFYLTKPVKIGAICDILIAAAKFRAR